MQVKLLIHNDVRPELFTTFILLKVHCGDSCMKQVCLRPQCTMGREQLERTWKKLALSNIWHVHAFINTLRTCREQMRFQVIFSDLEKVQLKNYRHATITSVFRKTLGQTIKQTVFARLEENKQKKNRQLEFIPSISCETNLISF